MQRATCKLNIETVIQINEEDQHDVAEFFRIMALMCVRNVACSISL